MTAVLSLALTGEAHGVAGVGRQSHRRRGRHEAQREDQRLPRVSARASSETEILKHFSSYADRGLYTGILSFGLF